MSTTLTPLQRERRNQLAIQQHLAGGGTLGTPASVRAAHDVQRRCSHEPPAPWSLAVARLREEGRLPAVTRHRCASGTVPRPWSLALAARQARPWERAIEERRADAAAAARRREYEPPKPWSMAFAAMREEEEKK